MTLIRCVEVSSEVYLFDHSYKQNVPSSPTSTDQYLYDGAGYCVEHWAPL